MALIKIPTRTDDSLGRVKYDQRPATDLETQIQASEYNATADAVIAVSEAVGLADGSTPGSLEARMADALARLDDAETCCATNGDRLDVIEPKVATLETDGDAQARQRLDVVEPKVTALEAGLGRRAWGYFQHSGIDNHAEMVKGFGLAYDADEVEPGIWRVRLDGSPDVTSSTVLITADSDEDEFALPVVWGRTVAGEVLFSFIMLDGSYREGPPPPFSIMVQA